MINTHAFMGLNEALDMEVQQQTMLAQTEDFKEGISAFMQKRKPVYQGKWLLSLLYSVFFKWFVKSIPDPSFNKGRGKILPKYQKVENSVF